MGKLGGGGLILVGIVLVLVGALLESNLVEWLLDVMGLIIIVGGVVIGVVGLIKVFSGKGSDSSGY